MHDAATIRLAGAAPRLSIVIPASCGAAALEETLVSVLENRPDDCEIIVALACEYDDPWNIREEVVFVRAPEGASAIGCLNLGISSCSGEIIHVLSAGWKATPGWADAAIARFDDAGVAAVVPLAVADADRDRVVAAGMTCSAGGHRRVWAPAASKAGVEQVALRLRAIERKGGSTLTGPLVDAGFWRADVLATAGPGFAADCGPTMADADLAVAIDAAGGRSVIEPSARVIAGPSSQPVSRFAEGLHAERFFWRSIAGRPLVQAILLHLLVVARQAVLTLPLGTLPMLMGRLVAALQFGSYGGRYRQLRSLMAARDMADAEETATLRLDPEEPSLPRPRHLDGRRSLRRSA